MVGGAPPLATTAKGAATTVGGATTQAGSGKVSGSSSLYIVEASIWRGFYLWFQPPPLAVQPSHSGISPLTRNLPELDRFISYIKASAIRQYMLKHIDKDSNTVWKKEQKA